MATPRVRSQRMSSVALVSLVHRMPWHATSKRGSQLIMNINATSAAEAPLGRSRRADRLDIVKLLQRTYADMFIEMRDSDIHSRFTENTVQVATRNATRCDSHSPARDRMAWNVDVVGAILSIVAPLRSCHYEVLSVPGGRNLCDDGQTYVCEIFLEWCR